MTQRQKQVNNMNPASAKAKLGDTVAELVAQVNQLTAKHNALLAKLDADAGVTDVNYAATQAVPTATIKSLEDRA